MKEHMGLGTVETYSVSSHEPKMSPSLSGMTISDMHSLMAFSTSPSLYVKKSLASSSSSIGFWQITLLCSGVPLFDLVRLNFSETVKINVMYYLTAFYNDIKQFILQL
jgi:hypothetical protein